MMNMENVGRFMDLEEEHRKQMEDRQAAVEGLSLDCHQVDCIRFRDDKMEDYSVELRSSGLFQRMIPGWDQEHSFSRRLDLMRRYLVYEQDREQFHRDTRREMIRPTLLRGAVYYVPFRVVLDGEIHYAQLKCAPGWRPGEEPDRMIVAFLLVDEQMRKEKEDRETLERALALAQSASHAKTAFLNNVSHDIRTPMNAIIGYTGLAASHIDNRELALGYLNKINQSAEHLLSLIDDLLDMSRIESGRIHLNESTEKLPEIIQHLWEAVQADVRARHLDFRIDCFSVQDENIICDRLRLHQVLLNVISNAIKYTADYGRIALRVSETGVTEDGRATYEFRVRDNGMGMTREFLENIFDPFENARAASTTGVQGTGIGMTITRSIVKMLGGTMDIASEVGKGTEVIIRCTFSLAEEPWQPEPVPQLQALRTLVVNEDPDGENGVTDLLRRIGMRAESCRTGMDALNRVREGQRNGDPFRICVLNRRLPDSDGLSLTRIIRATADEESLTILLTAFDWQRIADEARKAGVSGFCGEPLFPAELYRALTRFCATEEEVKAPEQKTYLLAGRRILLVDDNMINREIATELLEEEGIQVETAEDGTEAVARMQELADHGGAGGYDAVLMDIQMPVMDGYEATRIIRQMPAIVRGIPIIAMTANAFDEDRAAALKAGMNEHIAKPIDMDRLMSVLKQLIIG